MRFVHTSDWHLGRLYHGQHLTEDQAYALEALIGVLEARRPQVLLIAGDVYDRALPPVEAVQLLDRTLERIVLDLGIPVIAIAGNHDSGTRLAFGSRLLAERGLHVAGAVGDAVEPVALHDEHGPVYFHPIPYAEPAQVRTALAAEDVHDHDAALRAQIARVRASADPGARHVLLAHAFVTGGLDSESERPLSVGGAGTVGADALAGFHYVALGHLHRPQRVGGSETVRYSGSLLKYSFSEHDHRKAVLLVEMDADGRCEVEPIPLPARRDVRVLEGRLDDLLARPDPPERREDYLLVRLTDTDMPYDPLGKLRRVYPNVLQVERPGLEGKGAGGTAAAAHRTMTDRDLFHAFYKAVTGNAVDAARDAELQAVLEDLERRSREVEP